MPPQDPRCGFNNLKSTAELIRSNYYTPQWVTRGTMRPINSHKWQIKFRVYHITSVKCQSKILNYSLNNTKHYKLAIEVLTDSTCKPWNSQT